MQTYSTVLNLCPRKATTVPHKVSAVDYLLAWAIWKMRKVMSEVSQARLEPMT